MTKNCRLKSCVTSYISFDSRHTHRNLNSRSFGAIRGPRTVRIGFKTLSRYLVRSRPQTKQDMSRRNLNFFLMIDILYQLCIFRTVKHGMRYNTHDPRMALFCKRCHHASRLCNFESSMTVTPSSMWYKHSYPPRSKEFLHTCH